MSHAAPTLVLLVFVSAAGCELVSGIEDKILVSSADDATAKDAPSTLDGPRPADGVVDSPLSDANIGIAPDAPVDEDAADSNDTGSTAGDFTAPDAGPADPSAPCSAQPQFLFCDDFDTETTIPQKWLYQQITDDGGTLGFFPGAYTSPPRSMLVTAPATSGAPQVVLGQTVGTLSTRFQLGFDLRIDMESLTNVPSTAVAQIIGQRQGKILELSLSLMPSGQAHLESIVSVDGGAPREMALPALPLRTWTRLVIAYDASAGVSVREDGRVIGSDPTATGGAPQATQLQMGMVYQLAPGTDTVRFEIDNVVFRGL